jgi:hypothetical protein
MSSTGEQQRAVDGTKLIPLLYYIQKIERCFIIAMTIFYVHHVVRAYANPSGFISDIHELDNDVVVDKIIETEFSPGAIFMLV